MSFRSRVSGFIRFIFLLAFIALPFVIFFAVRTPPGVPVVSTDASQQADNFERKLIFIEQSWTQKQSAEVGFTAAEVNAAYSRDRGDDMLVAFLGNQAELFVVKKISVLDVYIQATGKLSVSQHRLVFTPTDLQIGTLPLPPMLANSLIQQKLQTPAMQEQMRLPAYISSVRVKDGQLMLGTSPRGR